jgi:hypothetical protein
MVDLLEECDGANGRLRQRQQGIVNLPEDFLLGRHRQIANVISAR